MAPQCLHDLLLIWSGEAAVGGVAAVGGAAHQAAVVRQDLVDAAGCHQLSGLAPMLQDLPRGPLQHHRQWCMQGAADLSLISLPA